jgi:GNAT superfamily N-acetyltransferase
MRFLLDTNILLPLEDSQIPLVGSLANFVRLAHEHGHQLVYHPASEDDIQRDTNLARRQETLARLRQYTRLQDRLVCPWNTNTTNQNDASDNEILYALECDAAHALVTEDRGIHDKARARGFSNRVYTIQTADDWLRRLHELVSVDLPNVGETSLYRLTPLLGSEFFDSLRAGYPGFDDWFRESARENTKAWVTWERQETTLGAICIFKHQANETITQEGLTLTGPALKLSTFKVGDAVRGKKIGELFLKAAFRYASANHLEHIFIHGDLDEHHFLFELLEDFGFTHVGSHPGPDGRDAVYLKKHPIEAPVDNTLVAFEYLRHYFPHYLDGNSVGKFIVPIRPEYHRILFPDYESPSDRQMGLFRPSNSAGNAIKMAYLCHSQTKGVKPGDVVLFYRSADERAITSLGVVEDYQTLSDASQIARLVSRRTVYSMQDIEAKARKPTKVMLFRLVRHFNSPPSHDWLLDNQIIKGNFQSIRALGADAYTKILEYADR